MGCVGCIRAFDAAIAIVLEASPPLLRVAIIEPFYREVPNNRGRPLGITANAFFGSRFSLAVSFISSL